MGVGEGGVKGEPEKGELVKEVMEEMLDRRLDDRALGLIKTGRSSPPTTVLGLGPAAENTSTTYATASSRASSPERYTNEASALARMARHSANAAKGP